MSAWLLRFDSVLSGVLRSSPPLARRFAARLSAAFAWSLRPSLPALSLASFGCCARSAPSPRRSRTPPSPPSRSARGSRTDKPSGFRYAGVVVRCSAVRVSAAAEGKQTAVSLPPVLFRLSGQAFSCQGQCGGRTDKPSALCCEGAVAGVSAVEFSGAEGRLRWYQLAGSVLRPAKDYATHWVYALRAFRRPGNVWRWVRVFNPLPRIRQRHGSPSPALTVAPSSRHPPPRGCGGQRFARRLPACPLRRRRVEKVLQLPSPIVQGAGRQAAPRTPETNNAVLAAPWIPHHPTTPPTPKNPNSKLEIKTK